MAEFRDENAPEVPATPARQGALGKPVMIVLLVSVTLAFVGLMAAWLFRADDLDVDKLRRILAAGVNLLHIVLLLNFCQQSQSRDPCQFLSRVDCRAHNHRIRLNHSNRLSLSLRNGIYRTH